MFDQLVLWCAFALVVTCLPLSIMIVFSWLLVHAVSQFVKMIGVFQAILEYVWYRKSFHKWMKAHKRPEDTISETLKL